MNIKQFILFCSILLFVQGIYAYVGIKLIGGYATYFKYESEYGTETSNPGIWGGLGIEDGTSKFSFSYDLLLAFKNPQFKLHGKNIYYKLNSLYMDLYLKYKFKRNKSPYLIGGGAFGFVLARRTNAKWNTIEQYDPKIKFDCGIVFGAGFQVDFFKTSVLIEGRYRFGLANIELKNIKFNSSSFAIYIGVIFW